jgi:hypothetical protein
MLTSLFCHDIQKDFIGVAAGLLYGAASSSCVQCQWLRSSSIMHIAAAALQHCLQKMRHSGKQEAAEGENNVVSKGGGAQTINWNTKP